MKGLFIVASLVAIGGCSDPVKGKTARELNPTEVVVTAPIDQTIDVAALGMDVYPGAKPPKGLSPMVHNKISESLEFVDCFLTTTDPPEKVIEFYHKRLKKAVIKKATGQPPVVEAVNRAGEPAKVRATWKPEAKHTAIILSVTKKSTSKS